VKNLLKRLWNEDQGVLTFEWILVVTLLVIGIVGGYSAVRDAVVDELGDVCDAVIAVDQSFTTTGPACCPANSWGSFQDDDPTPTATRGRLSP
jgi:Flp pilus assembly pilin Flp